MTRIPRCARCGHFYHEKECRVYYDELNRPCKCGRENKGYLPLRRRWKLARWLLCRGESQEHPEKVMVTVHIDVKTGDKIKQCPKCVHRVLVNKNGKIRPYDENVDTFLTRD